MPLHTKMPLGRIWTLAWVGISLIMPRPMCAQAAVDFATYLGGSGAEWGYAVATDANGFVYVAGMTASNDFPVSSGVVQTHFGGGKGDVFVTKIDPATGKVVYSTYLGGTHGEGDAAGYVGGIAVDAEGNAYVTGVTYSADFPVTAGAYQRSFGSKEMCGLSVCGDAFVFKLNPTGTALVYSTFLGGANHDEAKAIAIDSTGAAYVTGITSSLDFPTSVDAFQKVMRYEDAFVTKLSPDGSSLVYSTLLGGSEFDFSYAIAVDSAGRAHVAGMTSSADFPLKNSVSGKLGEPWDAFVVRLNASGTGVEFSTLLGGAGSQQALGIALNSAGDMYVAGYTDSADFPVVNAFQTEFGGGDGNGFVAKLRADGGGIVYSTFLGGADGLSELDGIAVNSRGEAFVAGSGGRDFPVVNSARAYRAAGDVVVAKLTADGSGLLWSTFFVGGGYDLASGIALDVNGHVVVTGQTQSPDLVLANASQTKYGGAYDAFVLRLNDKAVAGPTLSAPKLIAFGKVYVGVLSAPKSLRISNAGLAALHVNRVVTSSNVIATSTCASVDPGASCTLSASLKPAVSGAASGTVTLYDDAADSPQTFFVTGTGVSGGDLQLVSFAASDPKYTNGAIAINFTAVIRNNGPFDAQSVTLRISNNLAGTDCTPCSLGTIAAGATAPIQFTRISNVFGDVPVTATVGTTLITPDLNDANNSQTIIVPVRFFTVKSEAFSFGTEIVNRRSAAQTLTIAGTGAGPFHLTIGTTGDFLQTNDCGSITQSGCTISIWFAPKAEGARVGTLTIYEDKAADTVSIPLSGTGLIAPYLDISATSLTFADVVLGGSGSQTISVANSGSAPLTLSPSLIGMNLSMTTDCPPSLAPFARCSIRVVFIPTSADAVTGSLTIATNIGTGVVVIPIAANGKNLVVVAARPGRSSRGSAGATSGTTPTSSERANMPPVVPAVTRRLDRPSRIRASTDVNMQSEQ